MSKKRSEYYLKSLNKAMQILNALAQENVELGVTELSKKVGWHKSTVHRILVTLEDERLVAQDKVTQKYRLGIKLFELGSLVQEQVEIRKLALPAMKRLAQETEESIDLNIISSGKRVSIEKIESTHDIRRIIQLGERLPLYCGGSGKALLAFLPEEEIDKILQQERLIPFTSHTITDPFKLKEHLKEIKKLGYATSFEERIPGSASVAAPIFNFKGKVVASLSISGPISRFTHEKLPKLIALVKDTTRDISFSLGGQENLSG